MVQVVERTAGLDVTGAHRSIVTAAVQRAPEPVQRRMVPLADRPTIQDGRKKFSVLTYNILADLYATQHAFPASEAHTLLWQYRRQLILRELALYDADIVCLQEVQSTNFHEDLRPEMDRRGFDAVFKKKTQVHMRAVHRFCFFNLDIQCTLVVVVPCASLLLVGITCADVVHILSPCISSLFCSPNSLILSARQMVRQPTCAVYTPGASQEQY